MKKLLFTIILLFLFLTNLSFALANDGSNGTWTSDDDSGSTGNWTTDEEDKGDVNSGKARKPIIFKPQVALPGTWGRYEKTVTAEGVVETKNGIPIGSKSNIQFIGKFIQGIYQYGIGIIGILAVVGLMIGGTIWTISGGNKTRVEEAKSWIVSSLTGLILALTSYMILTTINPDLVNFQYHTIQQAGEVHIVCCKLSDGDVMMLGDECVKKGGESTNGVYSEMTNTCLDFEEPGCCETWTMAPIAWTYFTSCEMTTMEKCKNKSTIFNNVRFYPNDEEKECTGNNISVNYRFSSILIGQICK